MNSHNSVHFVWIHLCLLFTFSHKQTCSHICFTQLYSMCECVCCCIQREKAEVRFLSHDAILSLPLLFLHSGCPWWRTYNKVRWTANNIHQPNHSAVLAVSKALWNRQLKCQRQDGHHINTLKHQIPQSKSESDLKTVSCGFHFHWEWKCVDN